MTLRPGMQMFSQFHLIIIKKNLQMQKFVEKSFFLRFLRTHLRVYLHTVLKERVKKSIIEFVRSVRVSGCGYDTLINNTLLIAS